jgi:GNAT superfamily N-acetyltransferase
MAFLFKALLRPREKQQKSNSLEEQEILVLLYRLAAHTIGIRFYFKPELAYATWLTQVVVDQKHRSKGIAYRLCSLACDAKDCFAYGLATSNPFTVKSLEKACGMKVNCSKVSLMERPFFSLVKFRI